MPFHIAFAEVSEQCNPESKIKCGAKQPLIFTEGRHAHYFTLCIPDVVEYCSSILMIQQLG